MRSALAASAAAALLATVVPTGSLALPVCADQSPVNTRCEVWSRFLQSAEVAGEVVHDRPVGVAATADGTRLYVVTTQTIAGKDRHALMAVDTRWGAPLWVAHPAHSSSIDRATHLALAPDESRILVAGSDANRTFVVAYSATGRVLWRVSSGAPRLTHQVNGLAIAPHGGARAFLLTTIFENAEDGVVAGAEVVALDLRNGRTLWRRRLSAAGAGIAVSPAGDRVYVAAAIGRGGGHLAAAAIALDARTGAVRWGRSARHAVSASPVSVAVTGRGDQVVLLAWARTTVEPAPIEYEWLIVSFATADGRERWRAVEAGDVHTSAAAYRLVAAGDRVYATGGTGRMVAATPGTVQVGVQRMTTVAYDARLGRKVWRVTYEPPGGYASVGTTIAATGSHVYVAGVLAPGLAAAGQVGYLAVVAYRADGTEAWVSRRDVRSPDEVAGLHAAGLAAPLRGGRVFVVAHHAPLGPPERVDPPSGVDAPESPACPSPPDACLNRGQSALLAAYAA